MQERFFRRAFWAVCFSAALVAFSLLSIQWSGGEATPRSDEQVGIDALVNHIDQKPRSEFQDAILSDGAISDAEIEDALQRFARCVTDAGGEIVGSLERNRWGGYAFSVGIPPIEYGVPNTAARLAADECHDEYWSVVGERWSATHMAPVEAVEEVLRSIPDCMREGGVEPPAWTGPGWASLYLETAERADGLVLMECLRAASAELGEAPTTLLMP